MTPSRTWTGSCGTGARIHLCFCLNRSSRVSDLFGRPPFLGQAYVADILKGANSPRRWIVSFNWVLSEIRNGILLIEQAAGLLLDRLAEIRVLAFGLHFRWCTCVCRIPCQYSWAAHQPLFSQWLESAGRRCLDQPFKVVAFGLMAEIFLSVKNRSSTRPEN